MNTSETHSFKSQLRQERIRRNWHQQDLADELGTTVASVKRWERGSQQPSVYFRVKLCALFEKSAEEFGLAAERTQPTHRTEAAAPNEALIIPSSSSEEALLWSVPFPHNPFFTGSDLVSNHVYIGQAELLFQRALAIRQKSLDPQHPDVERTLSHITNIDQMQQHTIKTFSRDQQARTVSDDAAFAVERRRDEHPACPACEQADEVVCSGVNRAGTQRFRCRSCQRYFTPSTRQRGYHPSLKAQALAFAQDGMSARTIAQKLAVHHSTVSLWIKQCKLSEKQ